MKGENIKYVIFKNIKIMKKKLSEKSFASLDILEQNIAKVNDGDYLSTHGVGYYSSDGNYYWVRTVNKTTSSEYQENYWDSTINVSEFIQEYSANSENGYGKAVNPITIADYNQFVKWGVWHGGYVKDFGYIDVAASSLYGNSIWANSWYAYGTKEYPVSVEDFYRISQKNQWRGGYVYGWDYVSDGHKILGCSSNISPVSVEDGMCTVGSIVNASYMLNENRSVESVFNDLKKYWSPELKRFIYDESVLSSILNKYFKATQISTYLQLNNALAMQKVVFCHYLSQEDELSDQYHDTIIVSGSHVKNGYNTLEPSGGLGLIKMGEAFKNGKCKYFILEKL